MAATIRPARDADLEPAAHLVARAINDLYARHGLAPDFLARPPVFQRHCLERDPEGLWVAEENGAMVGFGFAWVCGDFWFLAQLFIEPTAQSGGIGRALMEKTLRLEARHGTTNRALITFAYNRASTGLYLRHRLYPRQPIYGMKVSADQLAGRLGATGYTITDLPAEPSEWMGALDARVLGFRRDDHHRLQARSPGMRGLQINGAHGPVGYAYSMGGTIGPIAIDPAADARHAITAVLRVTLQDGPKTISLMAPGAAEAAMDALLDSGFQISETMVLLSTHPFGDWRNYLPRSPGYL